jgi:Pyruvate/2-oxoglutarate dehydrogenase complex, dihydrolipoamide dehydrogenase (E3) component, and related enzymes
MSKSIIIIGAGPGGYVAAIRAAQLGAQVTVVENQALGGVCLNSGCIPSKALLSVVELGDKAKKAADFGLTIQGPVGYDLARMVTRKNKVVEGLVKGIATLFKTWGIQHIEGTGEIVDPRTVKVVKRDGSESRIDGDAMIVATGSSWPNLPMFPIDGRQIITSKEALDTIAVPVSLLIVGGGVEGCEFAALYSGMGTQVTIVELLARILPLEDEEMSSLMTRELTKRGATIRTGTTVEKIERRDDVVKAVLKDGTVVEAEKLLISVGRGFNSKGIGLEKIGVQVGTRGEILVNARMETNVPGVYAIGDVVGKAMLAHVASAQGKVAVDNILAIRARLITASCRPGFLPFPKSAVSGSPNGKLAMRPTHAGITQRRPSRSAVFDMPAWAKRKERAIRLDCLKSLPMPRLMRLSARISWEPMPPMSCTKLRSRCSSMRKWPMWQR